MFTDKEGHCQTLLCPSIRIIDFYPFGIFQNRFLLPLFIEGTDKFYLPECSVTITSLAIVFNNQTKSKSYLRQHKNVLKTDVWDIVANKDHQINITTKTQHVLQCNPEIYSYRKRYSSFMCVCVISAFINYELFGGYY